MDPLQAEIVEALSQVPLDFGGGCSPSKAWVMAFLIRELDLKASLDIGVYRGRSLLPQALAQRAIGGMAFGVDPWTRDAAREHDTHLKDAIERFIDATDFEALYRGVDALRRQFGVEACCTLVRKTSSEAAHEFRARGQRFGLVHIDGNHDTAVVMQDAEDYLPLVQPGGIVVMDDVSWESVKPAREALAAQTRFLFERVDGWNDYAVFWKATGPERPAWLRVFEDPFVVSG